MDSSIDAVITWYENKTESILKKYGPGPRVHFHTGLVGTDCEAADSLEKIRIQLVESQEKLIQEAAIFWKVEDTLNGDILDVGCGFGGTSIYLAQNYAKNVIALTNIPGHIPYITEFIKQACVDDKVLPVLGDACSVPGKKQFDAGVAIEVSCYLDREAWFKHLEQRIKKTGYLFIADCFTENNTVRELFNDYWMTDQGSLEEYIKYSEMAGFRLEDIEDLTKQTEAFWRISIAFSRKILDECKIQEREYERLERSIIWQSKLNRLWKNKELLYGLLSLKKI